MCLSMSSLHELLLFLISWDVTTAFFWSEWPVRPECPDGYKSKEIKYLQFKCVRQDCPAGYFGDNCKRRCAFPYYGKNCQSICDCGRKLCDFLKGCPTPFPFCPDGYLGKYCETECRYPNYGQQCQQECLCPKVHCNISSGCLKYMNDSFKRHPTKPSNNTSTHAKVDETYNIATLENPSTISRKGTDQHICPDGFHGSNCKTPCRYPSYGAYCQKKCSCSRILCNATSGCPRSNHEEKNRSFATRRSTVFFASSARTTDEKEGKMEAKARHQVKGIPSVNIEILWSIVVLAVLTVSLVIGHIYLTFSKRLQRRRIHVQSSENVYSIADDE
ncbi:cell death abnormality protein 1-like isoform X2 [Saccostrea cucullata]|uniref:cell death abnormality protein 1-like isoform X2 n=1 Tax=Saccostrea cuccullata TaxID=36930 RepID=UPI002ED56669